MTPAPQPRARDAEPRSAEPSEWAMQYARSAETPLEPAPEGKVRIDLLTDPWSVWCWGFEPVRRALERRFPTVVFNNLLGGMFEELPDHDRLGFDVDRFFGSVQRATGMPIRSAAVKDDRPRSTYPACVHVHAVRLLAPEREDAFLRAMREAVYLDGLNVNRPEHATDLAERVGVDRREFVQAIDTGEPEHEFRERLAMLHGLGLHAYPTLLFTVGSKTARMEGFQPLPTVLNIIESMTGRLHPARPIDDVPALLAEGERWATREVAEVLDISIEEAFERLAAAERDGALERTRHATGDVWARVV